MKKVILIIIFGCLNLIGFSQTEKIKNDSIMKAKQILGLRTTIYKVGDIAKAKEWYSKAFGVKPYFDQPFYVGFNIGGYELGLQAENNPSTKKTESVVTYWGVSDINKVYTHFLKIGAKENEKPENVGASIITATVIDPWGNIIGIIYNPDFKIPD